MITSLWFDSYDHDHFQQKQQTEKIHKFIHSNIKKRGPTHLSSFYISIENKEWHL